jgi:hypothetical protein
MENPNPVVFAVDASGEEPFIYDASIPLTSENIFSNMLISFPFISV